MGNTEKSPTPRGWPRHHPGGQACPHRAASLPAPAMTGGDPAGQASPRERAVPSPLPAVRRQRPAPHGPPQALPGEGEREREPALPPPPAPLPPRPHLPGQSALSGGGRPLIGSRARRREGGEGGASSELPRRHRSARARPTGSCWRRGGSPRVLAAEIGGGPGPLPAQVAAARRAPRRAACEVSGGGHLCRGCGLRSPGPGAAGPVPRGVPGVPAAEHGSVPPPPPCGGQRGSGSAGGCEGKVSSWKGGGWGRRCPAGLCLWAEGDREAALLGSVRSGDPR